jgi:hypothetical protein
MISNTTSANTTTTSPTATLRIGADAGDTYDYYYFLSNEK